ncbi:MAG: hypothetical protein N5P05_003930 [Chroococcopsis gigantea SAG 12.99]|jgi:Zn-finger nucleic acid-binding protein|nr:zf-TFIIB domain-containing protein [Chlorogloea purpurea SAG 13.99]MDV3002324.1 hypothetical protein [Chroococcopsis gigantea SAG 12.99]
MGCIGCPQCRGKLEKVIYQSIEIDRCSLCRGIWFDRLEAEELRRIKGSESVDIGKPTPCQGRPCQSVGCPRCGKTMVQMLDFGQQPLWYEKCSQCQGMWLEAGRFKVFKQNLPTPGNWARNKAKQVLTVARSI